MPGIVAFRRRWSVGSDDLVVPGLFLFTIHSIWVIILTIVLPIFHNDYDRTIRCVELLWFYKIGYLSILFVSSCVELAICVISMRGSILDTTPRASMKYWLYIKFVVILIDITWLVLGIIWLKEFYLDCPIGNPKEIMLGLVISNWLVITIILITVWCTFDAAGRSWVKMKKYQRSMKESESRFNYKRSGSRNRNWRQRKVIRAYQDSWDHRCRLMFCCMGTSERNRNSFADIARLLSDFFRDLDVVPSDVIAGLALLRKFQKLEREAIVRQKKNGTYEFLSGVPITERTQFLALNDPKDYDLFQNVIHYMHYAHGAYGWPMFMITYRTGVCQLCSQLRCCLSCCGRRKDQIEVVKDNCCHCNYAALKKMLDFGEVDVIYATYHVDVGETPFFVSVDYAKRKIVVGIRGTLSMKDVLTDLNAEGECLPLNPPREDFIGHKGMVQAAVYLKNKLEEEDLIQRALHHNPERNTHNFGLVLLGHSLGAGTAAILAILLKQQYPSLVCYSYSPPGGLLSMAAVEYSKTFITSVVVGKDVVPRIGLHQMETLRADLINAIKRSIDPKWKTITCSVICCGCGPEPTSVSVMSSKDANINAYEEQRTSARQTSHHPNDSSIALTLHRPLFPPGRIIHIVRHHPSPNEHKYEKGWRHVLKKHEPVYQAIWAENTDFDEVLISPVMLQDHMPDKVLAALNKVITTFGPRKPQRQSSNANSSIASDIVDLMSLDQQQQQQYNNNRSYSPTTSNNLIINHNSSSSPHAPHKICLETSFTSLQSPIEPMPFSMSDGGGCGGGGSSKASSLAGSIFGQKSQLSSILQYDVSSIIDDCHTKSISGPSEATTVVLANEPHKLDVKSGKNVAFDVSTSSFMLTPTSPYPCLSPSPGVTPKSILHKQPTTIQPCRPASLSMNGTYPRVESSSQETIKKLDLIHDDWFGLAPLASPESLSEISSISSRASMAISLAASIEKCLQGISLSNDDVLEIDESQLHTPKIMRRAPKITGNLSKCADDWRLVDKYKRMGKVFITGSVPSTNSDSNSEQSFETASSLSRSKCCDPQQQQQQQHQQQQQQQRLQENSKSADNLDEQYDNLYDKKLTISDSAIIKNNNDNDKCISNCPKCPCRNLPQTSSLSSSSYCCTMYDHTLCVTLKQFNLNYYNNNNSNNNSINNSINNNNFNTTNTNSSSDTYHSAFSSLTGIEQNNGQINKLQFNDETNFNTPPHHHHSSVSSLKAGVLESHFPVFLNKTNTNNNNNNLTPEHQTLLPQQQHHQQIQPQIHQHHQQHHQTSKINFPSKLTNDSGKRNINFLCKTNKRNNDDIIFAKNESLPLLANLTEKSSSSPTSYVKRKKYVYPMMQSTVGYGGSSGGGGGSGSGSSKKGESNV